MHRIVKYSSHMYMDSLSIFQILKEIKTFRTKLHFKSSLNNNLIGVHTDNKVAGLLITDLDSIFVAHYDTLNLPGQVPEFRNWSIALGSAGYAPQFFHCFVLSEGLDRVKCR